MTLSADNPIETVTSKLIPSCAAQLAYELRDPSLWNRHRLRTDELGPHRYVSDIWVRCLDWEVMRKHPEQFNEPHESSWYPVAQSQLALARELAMEMFRHVDGVLLGGVLITKIPAGTCVLPHIDHGWHARHYEKYALSIAANPLQEFCFERKRLITQAGDWFTFDNRYTHWVTNPSPQDRITMIVCIRRPVPPDPNGPT